MAGVNEGLPGTECDNRIAVGCPTRHFHSGRSDRHSCNGKATYATGFRRKQPLHIGDRNVALESKAIDQRSVAGCKLNGQPNLALKRCPIGIVDYSNAAAERLAYLCRPLHAASATWVAVHHGF